MSNQVNHLIVEHFNFKELDEETELEVTRRVTLCAFTEKDKVAIGFSIKNPVEKCDKKKDGLKCAINRALKWLDKPTTRYTHRLHSDKNAAPSYIEFVYEKALPKFIERRCAPYSYYKDKLYPDWVKEVLS